MWVPPNRTLPRPTPPPLPERISLVTVLVIRNVASIARNIHIIGRSEDSPEPIVIVNPEPRECTVESAPTRTTPPPCTVCHLESTRRVPSAADLSAQQRQLLDHRCVGEGEQVEIGVGVQGQLTPRGNGENVPAGQPE